jgi:hypothetical protein
VWKFRRKRMSSETPSIESTSETCAGCGKTLSLLENYLKIAVKTERAVIVEQPLSEWQAIVSGEERSVEAIKALAAADEEEETVRYLGTRSGAGEIVRVHNGQCAQQYFEENYPDEKPKIKLLRAEEDDYESVGRSSE